MHAEYIDVSKETIQNIKDNTDKTIVAVGTTSLRTIESLYWIGVRIAIDDPHDMPHLQQWDPYDIAVQNMPAKEALDHLLNYMEERMLDRLVTKTGIIIAPGYKIKIAKALITNFHQPLSTLLLLVAAITGKDWRKIYDHALQNNYRFLSYGDGCLLWIDR